MTGKSTHSVPLVQETNGVYECHPRGMAFLRSCEGQFGVVAVAGRYRSGKSFLLNRGIMRLPPKQGFQTAGTVNACTKGIWVFPALVDFEGTKAVVLDTEGTGSREATPDQDTQLLSIAASLASVFPCILPRSDDTQSYKWRRSNGIGSTS